jgi:phospholipase C
MSIPVRVPSAVLCSAVLLLVSLAPKPAHTQAVVKFQHVVIVVQENRTPDNLFGSTPSHSVCNSEDPFEPGVDIKNCGYDFNGNAIYLTSRALSDGLDPGHGHPNWNDQCDFDLNTGACKMDGTCKSLGAGADQCFAYVPKTDVQAYFDIATNYGFANYFFQTNQGPSLPAHQFLLSGTSAPVPYLTTHYDWFDAGNTQDTVSGHGVADDHTGCTATYQTEFARLIDPSGSEGPPTCSPGNPYCQFPCYDHPTLVDLLDGAAPKISWKYYAPTAGGLWNAPTAIKKICVPNQSFGGQCTGSDWLNYVGKFLETKQNPVPIYADINNCQLPAVSWVIPDKKWSDHAGAGENDGSGPYYVANIINGIGWSACTDPVGGVQVPYWKDTVIFIVWDDWGGWFDHVSPFKLGGQTNNWGKSYTYGFRVPFLVVSAYTPAGYVSGALPSPGMDAQHTHDFGSILAFIENNFGLPIGGIGGSSYPFADNWAPELAAGKGVVPLGDFFPSTSPRLFQGIPVDPLYGQSNFQNYFTVTNPSDTPDGPDADDD